MRGKPWLLATLAGLMACDGDGDEIVSISNALLRGEDHAVWFCP